MSGRSAEERGVRGNRHSVEPWCRAEHVLGSGPGGYRIPDMPPVFRSQRFYCTSRINNRSEGRPAILLSSAGRDLVNSAHDHGYIVEISRTPRARGEKLAEWIKQGIVVFHPIP